MVTESDHANDNSTRNRLLSVLCIDSSTIANCSEGQFYVLVIMDVTSVGTVCLSLTLLVAFKCAEIKIKNK